MIRYSLKCPTGHRFDSWFQNADAFGVLQASRQLTCGVCGQAGIEKDLMSPGIRSGTAAIPKAPPEQPAARLDLSQPTSEVEKTIAAWRTYIETHSEYVGGQFAREVRRIHDGDAPERLIHGEAEPDEARKLIQDGLTIAPLPFVPLRKTN